MEKTEKFEVEGRATSRLNHREAQEAQGQTLQSSSFVLSVPLCGPFQELTYIFPAFMSATRFSKFVVSTLSALPRAIAWSARARASSLRPAA
jgi:hypothetical protein